MFVHFYLRYATQFGQTIFVTGDTEDLGNDDPAKAFPLEYLNDQLWHGQVNIDDHASDEPIRYKYFIRQDNGPELVEFGDDRLIKVDEIKSEKLVLIDTWNHPGTIENVFFAAPFQEVLLKKKQQSSPRSRTKKPKKFTHEFRVKAPILNDDELIGISGSASQLNDWDKANILPCSKAGNWWTIKLDLSSAEFPLLYKYAVVKAKDNQFVKFEEGNNRILLDEAPGKKVTILHDGFAYLRHDGWRGAGSRARARSRRRRWR